MPHFGFLYALCLMRDVTIQAKNTCLLLLLSGKSGAEVCNPIRMSVPFETTA